MKANGYPELERVEEHMAKAYARLESKSLHIRLAYSAGFESMTNGFTHWLITKRVALFKEANPHVSSFWIMPVSYTHLDVYKRQIKNHVDEIFSASTTMARGIKTK